MRIGILGGTFDPVHYGHLRPAAEVLQLLQLDQLWLMPNNIPPHKQQASASAAQRLQMLQLATGPFPQFSINAVELERATLSYSVTTLRQLRQEYPQDTFYFIMGTDSLVTLTTWQRWQELFDLCHLVICRRAGWQLQPDNPVYNQWQQRQTTPAQHLANCPPATAPSSGDIIMVDVAPQPYSSTALRQALADNRLEPCQNAIPASVLDYITTQQLYRN
ncbi:nicotinate-nucleotide adenylyltransferase [Shewanella sp. YIC-542]|uniref:nicotinate-nucleotide adenylyltransferase n=1 Tax=Shewanella mytili TaxID=3377111 RepID=UPI00398EF019